MDAALREQYRLNLLQQLDAMGSIGMPVVKLKLGARIAGFEPTDDSIRDELQYLEDATFVKRVDKPLSPELARWRITKAGRDFLATQGLA